MEWLIFALLAPALWAMNNVTAKILIDKKFRDPFPFAILMMLVDLIFVIPIGIVMQISFDMPYVLYAIITGVISFVSFWFYFNAVKIEETSRISTLTQMTPIFVTILSAILLNEILEQYQYIGIVMIVIASVMISYKRVKGKSHISEALKFVIAFALIMSAYNILVKYTLNYIDSLSVFFWSFIGMFSAIPIMLSMKNVRRDLVKIVKDLNKKTVLALLFKEILWFFGYMAYIIAASEIYISIVSGIGAIEPIFVFIYATVLSVAVPKLLKEEIKKSTVFIKIVAILLTVMGMWMLNVL